MFNAALACTNADLYNGECGMVNTALKLSDNTQYHTTMH